MIFFFIYIKKKKLESNVRRIVRNGHGRARTLNTEIGKITVNTPRIVDRLKSDSPILFFSDILPPYSRQLTMAYISEILEKDKHLKNFNNKIENHSQLIKIQELLSYGT